MLTTAPRGYQGHPARRGQWLAVCRNPSCATFAAEFNYQEIRTPIFEHTELFQRGIGDGTDVVDKEMYTFNDRSGRGHYASS